MSIVNQSIPIEAIEPHPLNYNMHPPAQIRGLQASHEAFEQYRSVVVWQRPGGTYIQVAGHGVVEALRKNGETSIRADILPEDTDPHKVEAILLADNHHGKHSEPNSTMLQQLLRSQAQAGQNLAALGLGKPEADRLLSQLLAEQKTDFLASVLTSPPTWVGQLAAPDIERALPEQRAEQGALIADPGEQWVTMSFTVTLADRETILAALRKAKTLWTLPTQPEALVQIMHHFVASNATGEV